MAGQFHLERRNMEVHFIDSVLSPSLISRSKVGRDREVRDQNSFSKRRECVQIRILTSSTENGDLGVARSRGRERPGVDDIPGGSRESEHGDKGGQETSLDGGKGLGRES